MLLMFKQHDEQGRGYFQLPEAMKDANFSGV